MRVVQMWSGLVKGDATSESSQAAPLLVSCSLEAPDGPHLPAATDSRDPLTLSSRHTSPAALTLRFGGFGHLQSMVTGLTCSLPPTCSLSLPSPPPVPQPPCRRPHLLCPLPNRDKAFPPPSEAHPPLQAPQGLALRADPVPCPLASPLFSLGTPPTAILHTRCILPTWKTNQARPQRRCKDQWFQGSGQRRPSRRHAGHL